MHRPPTAWLSLFVWSGSFGLGLLGCDGSSSPSTAAGETGSSGASGSAPGPGGSAAVDCSSGAVADTPLRRLTRSQYDNTVADLLGVRGEPAKSFPDDDRAGAFPANAKQSVSDAHVRRFMDAAEKIAGEWPRADGQSALTACDASIAARACAEQHIRALGARAFRRPLSEEQVTDLLTVFDVGTSPDGFAAGMELVVQAMLESPSFLYHIELKPSTAGGEQVPLEGHELASRLAYFFWQTLPDAELTQAAEQGRLASVDGVRQQAERLLSDPRALASLDSFHGHWLGIQSMDQLVRDARLFPSFSPEIARAMRQETLDFSRHVFASTDSSLATLLTSSKSLVPDALLPIYGASRPAGQNAGQLLELHPAQRAGVLTHASVLAAHSPSDHTSPVKRGVFILDNLLCQQITLPVGIQVPELPPLEPNQSSRERFLMHEQPGCAGCHIPIDHLGFAYERYDSLGQYQTMLGGKPIDDSGALRVGSSADGDVVGAVEMAGKLASAPELRSCFTRQWLRFALAREETEADACVVAELERRFAESNLSLRELALSIVEQDNFRFRPSEPQ